MSLFRWPQSESTGNSSGGLAVEPRKERKPIASSSKLLNPLDAGGFQVMFFFFLCMVSLLKYFCNGQVLTFYRVVDLNYFS